MRFTLGERGGGRPEYLACFAPQEMVCLEWRDICYRSRVEAVDRGGLLVTRPTSDKGEFDGREGDKLVVIVSSSRGLRCFQAIVLERVSGSPDRLRIGLRADLGVLQRRDFARAPLMLPVRFHVLRGGALEADGSAEGTTRDVGGGGMLIIMECPHAPAIGNELVVNVALPDGFPVHARAEVVRVDSTADHPRVFRVSVRFTQIEERDQDRIQGRVLARQAELRRAGLL